MLDAVLVLALSIATSERCMSPTFLNCDRARSQLSEFATGTHQLAELQPLERMTRYYILFDRPGETEIIYALIDATDPDRIRYVGRTRTPSSRYDAHCRPTGTPLGQWVSALATAGRFPTMVLLQRCRDGQASVYESQWINHFRGLGQADLNQMVPRPRVTGLELFE